MSRKALVWFGRAVAAVIALLVILLLSLFFIAGSESGTRWILAKVPGIAPVEFDADQVTGTLLSRLQIPSLLYRNPGLVLSIEELILDIDWSATTLDFVALDELAAQRVTIRTFGDKNAAPEPLEISMPALPVRLGASAISIDQLAINENTIVGITIAAFDALGKRFSADHLSAAVQNISIDASEFFVELDGDVPVGGAVAWRTADSSWAGQLQLTGSLLQLGIEHTLDGQYPAVTNGEIELLRRIEPGFDLTTVFRTINYDEWTVNDGEVHIRGTADAYDAEFSATVTSDVAPQASLSGKTAGGLSGFRALDIAATTGLGRARATGDISWSPEFSANLLVIAENVDASSFVALPAENINAEMRLVAVSAENFSIDVKSFAGTWNGQRSSGVGKLSRKSDLWACDACKLNVGSNRLNVDGRLEGRSLNGVVSVNAPSLQQLWDRLKGSLIADGRLSGTVALPVLSGSASANGLAFDEWSIGTLSVKTRASTLENFDIDVDITEVVRDQTELGNLGLQLSGKLAALDLSAQWSLEQMTATLGANLAIEGDAVAGRIMQASVTEPFSGTWILSDSIEFQSSTESTSIGVANWANGDAYIRHDSILFTDGKLAIDGAIGGLPLALFNSVLPANVRIEGLADATIAISNRAGGWSGLVEWRQQQTLINFRTLEDDIQVPVPVAQATARFDDNAVTLQATVNAEPGFAATLNMSMQDMMTSSAPMQARLSLSGDEWEWVTALVPVIDNIQGSITADITAGGTIASPQLSGEARWLQGQLDIPALNLPLEDIRVQLAGTSAGDLTVEGEAKSGDGTLGVSGRVEDVASKTPSFDMKLSGKKARVVNWPAYQATASPDVTLAGDMSGVRVAGAISVDKADIVIRELPEGAVRPSADVIVVGREVEARQDTGISGEVDVALGDAFHFNAFGLDTDLQGRLRFVLREDRDPQGTGEVRLVGGFFEAYGQRLEIERGTMVFVGPLDEPLINVRAIRRVDTMDGTVTAGLNISGRASELNSTIFSDPAMSEAEALSYLVLGRPLRDASAADGSALSNSAYSLGLRQAALITNQIGQTVGLDELTFAGSNQNTTELVAGKKINSRLYARYAYGVFTRLGRLLLRYRLSESFSIELGAGDNQSMDILYTIEKD